MLTALDAQKMETTMAEAPGLMRERLNTINQELSKLKLNPTDMSSLRYLIALDDWKTIAATVWDKVKEHGPSILSTIASLYGF